MTENSELRHVCHTFCRVMADLHVTSQYGHILGQPCFQPSPIPPSQIHSLASSPMSILVNSVRTSWVEISATSSQTVLSSWFLSSLPPSEAFTLLLVALMVLLLLSCLSPLLASDDCLGLDWTSCVREWWTGLGLTGDFIAADHIHAH